TRGVGDVGQPRRMETCGAEEPYEGNLHVRFCGAIGRVIADPTRMPLRSVPRSESPRNLSIHAVLNLRGLGVDKGWEELGVMLLQQILAHDGQFQTLRRLPAQAHVQGSMALRQV